MRYSHLSMYKENVSTAIMDSYQETTSITQPLDFGKQNYVWKSLRNCIKSATK